MSADVNQGTQPGPFTPLAHIPWIRWIDRTELPSVVIGIGAWLIFIPFYDFNALMPRTPLAGAMFPPAFALALTFFLHLTRGATRDLRQLIQADKIDVSHLQSITAGVRAAWVELVVGLVIGFERVYAQVDFAVDGGFSFNAFADAGAIAISLSIIGYTVVQVHLLTFCMRQVLGFRRVASSYQVDLMAPELNNALSNPLIRFLMVGLVALSFGLLVYELVPYESMQRRLIEASLLGGLVWLVLIVFSLLPLLILKSRIAVAKAMEINVVRRALHGDFSGCENSQFGSRLEGFSAADLMFYEDRIKGIWEWPIEAHIRRLVLFGLLPPLTWVLAAAVEVVFDKLLAG